MAAIRDVAPATDLRQPTSDTHAERRHDICAARIGRSRLDREADGCRCMWRRARKAAITKSKSFGWMSRDFYPEEHDPERRAATAPTPKNQSYAASDADQEST